MNNIFKNVSLFLSVLAVSVIAGYAVLAWTEPSATPPGGQVAAPINTSANLQTKLGPLGFKSGGNNPYQIMMDGGSFALKNNAGVENFIVGQDGHVGIGTASPATTLDVLQGQLGTAAGNTLEISRQHGYTGNDVQLRTQLYRIANGSDWSTAALLLSRVTDVTDQAYISLFGSNVGIGTASPGAKLEVNGQIKITGGTPGIGKVLTSDAKGLASWSASSGTSQWVTSGSNIYYNTGNVGIGTASPAYKFDLRSGSTASPFHLSPSADDGLYLTSVGKGNGVLTAGAYYSGAYDSYPAGQEKLTAKYTSSWSVGGDEGWMALFSDSGLTPGVDFKPTARLSIWADGHLAFGGASAVDSPAMTLSAAGNLGLGTTWPSQKLDINGGNMIIRGSMLSGGSYFGMFVTAGNLPAAPTAAVPVLKTDNQYLYFQVGGGTNFGFIDSGGAYHTQSSRAVKENFVQVDPQTILGKIDQLPMYQWNYKEQDPSIKHIAPVAEDFYGAFGLGGDNKTIADIDPSGVALAGVKALSQKIKDQQSQIYEMRADMDAMKTEIKDLKSQIK